VALPWGLLQCYTVLILTLQKILWLSLLMYSPGSNNFIMHGEYLKNNLCPNDFFELNTHQMFLIVHSNYAAFSIISLCQESSCHRFGVSKQESCHHRAMPHYWLPAKSCLLILALFLLYAVIILSKFLIQHKQWDRGFMKLVCKRVEVYNKSIFLQEYHLRS
jgi:hypothetical protein